MTTPDLARYAEMSDGLAEALELIRAERDRLMAQAHKAGESLTDIARRTGITRQRVAQIVKGDR